MEGEGVPDWDDTLREEVYAGDGLGKGTEEFERVAPGVCGQGESEEVFAAERRESMDYVIGKVEVSE